MDIPTIQDFTGYFKDQFQNNDILVGIVFGSMLTMVWMSLRQMPGKVLNFVSRRFTTRVGIHSDDDMFFYFSQWISKQNFSKRNRYFKLISYKEYTEGNGPNKPIFVLTIGEGNYVFRYAGKWIWMSSGKDEAVEKKGTYSGIQISGNGEGFSQKREVIDIRYFGRSNDFMNKITEEVTGLYNEQQEDKLFVMRADGWNGEWCRLKELGKKGLDSVILKDNYSDEIVSDIDKFLTKKEWYEGMGIPYQRGYLFHGPPGTGKTSMAIALSSYLGRPIHCMNLGESMRDNTFQKLINDVEDGSIILMEDIDCAFDGRENVQSGGGKDYISYTTFLNAIDGVGAKGGNILVVTTNNVDKIDPALLRPGRLDIKYKFDNADSSQAERMFNRFYPDNEDLAKKFGEGWVDDKYSPATIQSLCMRNETPEEALASLENVDDYK